MQIVTPKQMIKIEERSEQLGVSKKELMLNAGRQLARLVDTSAQEKKGKKPNDTHVVFLAGAGNNGGDCYAAASVLSYMGYKVTVIILGGKPSTPLSTEMFELMPKDMISVINGYKGENVEAAIEAAELDYMCVSPVQASEIINKGELNAVDKIILRERQRMYSIREAVTSADILVDGVFGTGFRGQLDKDMMAIFGIKTNAYKIAVDVPSGGNCSQGTVSPGVFEADETITFGYIKTGMSQYPLKKYCGKITLADIGIPASAIEITENDRKYFRIERHHLKGFPPERQRDSHKGKFGRVLIIAGSSSMRGAAALAAMGALRSGAGIVQVASVERCIDTVAVIAPEAIYTEMECDDYGYMLFDDNKKRLAEMVASADAVVIGCGMGVTNDTSEITKYVVQNARVPVIVDADGINCIADDIDILVNKNTEVIITPHPGEMARLLKCDASMINENRITVAEKYAEKFNITVVLKGAGTLVANSRETAANHTGNAGMSRGGSGDVLAGIIGAIAAQGYSCFDASCAGVYIHGLAGDEAEKKLGQEAMLPRDIINNLSDAFKILKDKHKES
ncbi:MAG: NAD(P)H-hydrate dehydratase [Ruminococcus sp.]|nr:NAD(P)H-hydrate dehydratase [Ruminococcus sp.]